MQLALTLGKARSADIVMGTDPDADRLGIAAPDGDGYRLITGNELGVLLLDYILMTRQELGMLPKNGAFIKTIVTTELERLVAEKYGLSSIRCADWIQIHRRKNPAVRIAVSRPSLYFRKRRELWLPYVKCGAR